MTRKKKLTAPFEAPEMERRLLAVAVVHSIFPGKLE